MRLPSVEVLDGAEWLAWRVWSNRLTKSQGPTGVPACMMEGLQPPAGNSFSFGMKTSAARALNVCGLNFPKGAKEKMHKLS